MMVLVTYDIDLSDKSDGQRRLRQVAKKCESVGRRVQNSVFECWLDAAQLRELQTELGKMINQKTDSPRFYNLGNHYTQRLSVLGWGTPFFPDQPLIL